MIINSLPPSSGDAPRKTNGVKSTSRSDGVELPRPGGQSVSGSDAKISSLGRLLAKAHDTQAEARNLDGVRERLVAGQLDAPDVLRDTAKRLLDELGL